MIAYPMPSGVEHCNGHLINCDANPVIAYPMPSGVEHDSPLASWFQVFRVIAYPMPSGVEHFRSRSSRACFAR